MRPGLLVAACALAVLALLGGCDRALIRPAPSDSDSKALVDVRTVAPSVVEEMRYFGSHNFIGRPINGYHAAKCLLTRPAAEALGRVQAELRVYGLSLHVYDCYRPQRAVDDFVAWARDLADRKMKREFYPHVDKSALFADGYIAAKSGHSRGSTVDLTLEDAHGILEMGTAFDYFDPLAHTANPAASATAKRNRLLLKSTMEKFGFKNLPDEWWHFTLANEPFPNRYFDLEIN